MTIDGAEPRSAENGCFQNLRKDTGHDQIDVQALHIFNKFRRIDVGAGNTRDLFPFKPCPDIELL